MDDRATILELEEKIQLLTEQIRDLTAENNALNDDIDELQCDIEELRCTLDDYECETLDRATIKDFDNFIFQMKVHGIYNGTIEWFIDEYLRWYNG